jgi:hypothetical protein
VRMAAGRAASRTASSGAWQLRLQRGAVEAYRANPSGGKDDPSGNPEG